MHICCVYVSQSARQLAIEFSVNDLYKINTLAVPFGISYISSSLKQAGHTTEMVYCTPLTYKKGITNYIEKEPQVFAISITSLIDVSLAVNLIKELKGKYKNVKIIVGGPHVTTSAEQILRDIKDIDALCLGAGEKAVVEYVKQVQENKYYKTDNLWIKVKNDVIKCDKVLSIENLEELTYPDRDAWKQWIYHSNINKTNWEKWLCDSDQFQVVLISRGCIYSCIFCSNKELRAKINNKYFNVRKVEDIVAEIDYLVKKYHNLKGVMLEGENALGDIDRFRELCVALKQYNDTLDTKIEFSVNINFTPNLLEKDSDIIDLMAEANFTFVRFSLESGSFEIRKTLGKPQYNNDQFISFCNKLHQQKIDIMVYAMYCFPFETKETYCQTVNCLRQCKPEHFKYTWLELYDRPVNKKITLADIYRFFVFKFIVYLGYNNILKTILLTISIGKIIDRISEIRKFKFVRIKDNKNEELAKQELNKCNFKQAIEYFNKVKIDENNYWIYGDRAIAKMKIGDYKGAIKDFDKVLELNSQEIYKQKKQECLDIINKK